jgi:hypothetical protein
MCAHKCGIAKPFGNTLYLHKYSKLSRYKKAARLERDCDILFKVFFQKVAEPDTANP